MTSRDLARKKVVLSVVPLAAGALMLQALPGMAIRHGVPAVWVVVPLSLLAAAAIVNALLALQQWQKAKQSHD